MNMRFLIDYINGYSAIMEVGSHYFDTQCRRHRVSIFTPPLCLPHFAVVVIVYTIIPFNKHNCRNSEAILIHVIDYILSIRGVFN